jgi:hypothetical protein
MDRFIADVLMFAFLLALVGWVLYLFFRKYQVSTQVRIQRIESFNRLIEKFGNAKEFAEFAQSAEGKKLLEDPISPPPNPMAKVLRFVQAGILFIMIGVASWINAARLRSETDPNYVHQMIESNHWGTLATFFGIGLIVAAGVSYIFVKHWHMANGSLKK